MNGNQRIALGLGVPVLLLYLAFAAPWKRFEQQGYGANATWGPTGIKRTGLIRSPRPGPFSDGDRYELAFGQILLEAGAIVVATGVTAALLGAKKSAS